MVKEWETEFKIGIDLVDQQHHHLFKLANKLYDAATAGPIEDRVQATKLLGELSDYSLYHLQTEEDLFDQYGYPDAETHVKEHNLFRGKIQSIISGVGEVNGDYSPVISNAAEFAAAWLFGHLATSDRAYVEYFKKHGLE